MLFGDPATFAVEIHCEPVEPRSRGFGRMCIFVGGMRLGNLDEEHCSLFHAVDRIAEVASTLPGLWDERFSCCEPEAIFAYLDRALYDAGQPPLENLHRFDFLTNTGEQFDHEKSFVYTQPDGNVRVLLQRGEAPVTSAVCRSSEFKQVAAELVVWFRNQVQAGGVH